MADMKTCTACGETKPLYEFHKYTGKTARSPDGYRATCKECRCADERDKYAENKRRALVEAATK